MEIKKRIEELNDLEKIIKLREDLDKYRNSYYNDNIHSIKKFLLQLHQWGQV